MNKRLSLKKAGDTKLIQSFKKNLYNIRDIRSEKLFREAEDELYYFDNIQSAKEKIQIALSYNQTFSKALTMAGDIEFLNNNLKAALQYYLKAEKTNPNNVRILANLANLYEILNNTELATKYTNFALAQEIINPEIKKQLIEIKYSLLIKQKKYKEAQKLFDTAKHTLTSDKLRELQAENLFIIKRKLQIQQKIKQMNLKLVK